MRDAKAASATGSAPDANPQRGVLSGPSAGSGALAVWGTAGLTARCLARCLSLSLLVAAAASLCLAATPALAVTTHVFTTDFGAAGSTPANPYPLSNPADLAVDNSSGASQHDIYVTDPANHRVEKFDSAGNFLLMFGKDVDQTTGGNVCPEHPGDTCQTGTAGPGPGEFETPTFVAVDGSSGPSAGDVYVGDTADGKVSSSIPLAAWSRAGVRVANSPPISARSTASPPTSAAISSC